MGEDEQLLLSARRMFARMVYAEQPLLVLLLLPRLVDPAACFDCLRLFPLSVSAVQPPCRRD